MNSTARLRTACALGTMGVLILALPLTVAGQDFLPLDPGREWFYEDDTFGLSLEVAVTGQIEILGQTATVLERHHSSYLGTITLHEFYTRDAEDRVQWYGGESWINGVHEISVFDPPVLLLDTNLTPGHTWSSNTTVYEDLEATSPVATATVSGEVTAEENHTVPAGDFPSIRVHYIEETTDLTGTPARETSSADIWYSDGVGQIEFDLQDFNLTFQLVSWTGGTSVATGSLGQVKALYR